LYLLTNGKANVIDLQRHVLRKWKSQKSERDGIVWKSR
jgi:hypothetical protein